MKLSIILRILLALSFLTSCSSIPGILPVTPTPSPCPYIRSPGPPPPEVEKRAQDAFLALGAAGIRGKLRVEANGEYSCDHFAAEDINFQYTLFISDLNDHATMRDLVLKVKESARQSLQGSNMGVVTVRFLSSQGCLWDELQNACSPIFPLPDL